MAKRLADVEEVVVWAAAELARKPSPHKAKAPAPFDLAREDRELVGRWTRPAGFPKIAPGFGGAFAHSGPARGEPPHADALTVEAAIGDLASRPLPCWAEDLALNAGLGFPLDAAGALRSAWANVKNIVLVHGRLGRRPMFRTDPPEPSPKMAANGRPGVWRLERWAEPTFGDHAQTERDVETPVAALRKNHYPAGAFCIVEWSPAPQDVVDERAQYAAWRAGLEALAVVLHETLERWAPMPPRAAFRPWLGEADGAPIADPFRPGAERVYTAGEASALALARRLGTRRPVEGDRSYAAPRAGGAKSADEA